MTGDEAPAGLSSSDSGSSGTDTAPAGDLSPPASPGRSAVSSPASPPHTPAAPEHPESDARSSPRPSTNVSPSMAGVGAAHILPSFEADRAQFRHFLRSYTCYDTLPISGRVVVLDTALPVKKAFHALLQNELRAAPLFDSRRHKIIGMLTVTDFINILRYYHYFPDEAMRRGIRLDDQRIQGWRDTDISLLLKYRSLSQASDAGGDSPQVAESSPPSPSDEPAPPCCADYAYRPTPLDQPPHLVSASPLTTLLDAARELVSHRIHRLPILEPVEVPAVPMPVAPPVADPADSLALGTGGAGSPLAPVDPGTGGSPLVAPLSTEVLETPLGDGDGGPAAALHTVDEHDEYPVSRRGLAVDSSADLCDSAAADARAVVADLAAAAMAAAAAAAAAGGTNTLDPPFMALDAELPADALLAAAAADPYFDGLDPIPAADVLAATAAAEALSDLGGAVIKSRRGTSPELHDSIESLSLYAAGAGPVSGVAMAPSELPGPPADMSVLSSTGAEVFPSGEQPTSLSPPASASGSVAAATPSGIPSSASVSVPPSEEGVAGTADPSVANSPALSPVPSIAEAPDNIVGVISQFKILRFIAHYFPHRLALFDVPIASLGIGSFGPNVVTVTPSEPLITVLDLFATRRVSAVPVVDESGSLLDVYEKFDVSYLARDACFDNLTMTVREALAHRTSHHEADAAAAAASAQPQGAPAHGVFTCGKQDRLGSFFAVIRAYPGIRRLVILDDDPPAPVDSAPVVTSPSSSAEAAEQDALDAGTDTGGPDSVPISPSVIPVRRVYGVISLSDILAFLVSDPSA
ncbi:hypothetical protein H696_00369 [Fonticula alba]|uniref:CBS domain-containing protein n=1 Tax=Fonticula alba TaxID=691883 RepID=A0A058ZEF8_FONAL|nr:hypothetical protein H696_00369 [Fonticula alba]KCV72790.1 hypothetical protein H696_00369 [Fonticula alba]|eukprot:XP_009492491.1 hypothetical protein H696_00369 [Fonticula alba]